MIDCPIAQLMDDDICTLWLERYLHPDGFVCPRCGDVNRRLFRAQEHRPAYRCWTCDGYYTLLTGTVFEKTRQRPATLVLVLRGITNGEPTARLARELGLSRKQLHTLRHRIQAPVNDTAPTGVMTGTAFEADELYQNAGEKKHAASRSHGSATPTGARALTSSRRTSRDRGPSSIPTHGRVITGAIQPMRPSAMGSTKGPAMMMGTADARSMATPVKGPGRRSAPTCVASAGSTNSTSITTSRRMKRCATPTESHPS